MQVVTEARCRSGEDIYEHILRPRVKNPAKLWGEREWAQEWWNTMTPDEARFLERNGYLDVQLCENSRSQQLRRKPLPAGRPKLAQTRSHRATVRLTDDEYTRLIAMAELERCDPSEIIRRALDAYLQTK
ncbi:MAG: hypothetical protein ACYCYO_08295 [Bacilli bacterium]